MIANFFNKTKPAIILNLVMLFALFYFTSIFLFNSIDISSIPSIGLIIAIFLCFVFMLLLLNFILRKNNLTDDNSYALLITILLLGSFYETMFELNIFFSNLVLLLAFRKIYSIGSGIKTKSKLFDAGFWIGIATLIYSWSFLFLILVYFGILFFRKINLKDLFIPIVGFITPIIIYFTYHFYLDKIDIFYDKLNLDFSFNFVTYNALKLLIPITLLLALLIWCVVILSPKVVLMSNSFKLSWKIILIHLLLSIVIVVVSPLKNGSELFFLIIPGAIIIANILQKTESSTFKNLILYLFLAISIGVYFL
jgi:hypothetical protein